MSKYTFEATVRNDLGKGASRRLRRAKTHIPAIVYGGEDVPQPIALVQREFYRVLEQDEGIFTAVLTLNIDGKPQQAIIKDIQRHPFKPLVSHVDFQRVDASHKVSVHVPVHFINEATCAGVKNEGGKITHLLTEVEVTALPQHLIASIDIDMADKKVGDVVHLSDLQLPEGVEVTTLAHGGNDTAIVNVVAPQKGAADEGEEDAADSAE